MDRMGFLRKNERFELLIQLDGALLSEDPNAEFNVEIDYIDAVRTTGS
jgi:hypothetical protein